MATPEKPAAGTKKAALAKQAAATKTAKKPAAKPKPMPVYDNADPLLVAAADALTTFAMSYPGAWPDTPWGETVAKVKDKVFMFMGRPDGKGEGQLSFALKLPSSAAEALADPRCAPSGYGLGAKGWCGWVFSSGDAIDVASFHRYIDESYRAVAPKTLVKELDQRQP